MPNSLLTKIVFYAKVSTMLSRPTLKEIRIERQIEVLSRLHPTYTRRQLEECRENFLHYLDFVWKVYRRMQADGRLDSLLTEEKVNHMVNPLSPPQP
jgi:hypothetical protein